MAAFSRSKEEGIGFAKVIAPGNKADLNETEIVTYLGNDPDTGVIAMLLKSISDGAAFLEAVRAVTSVKPVVVLKTGRNKTAQRAAASHTAALAGDYRITAAALRQAGVRLVGDGLSLLDVAAALASQPPLCGNRIAIITNSAVLALSLPICWRTRARRPGFRRRYKPRFVSLSRRMAVPAIRSMSQPTGRALQMYGETLNRSWRAMRSMPSCRCYCNAPRLCLRSPCALSPSSRAPATQESESRSTSVGLVQKAPRKTGGDCSQPAFLATRGPCAPQAL